MSSRRFPSLFLAVSVVATAASAADPSAWAVTAPSAGEEKTVGLDGGLSVGFSLQLGKDAAGRERTVKGGEMTAFTVTREGNDVTAVWTGHPLCGRDFSVTARFRRVEDGYAYSFGYRSNESIADVEEIRFPEVTARRTDETSLLLPHQSGILYHSDWKGKSPGERMTKAGPRYMGFRFVAALNVGDLPSVYLDQRGDARSYSSRFEIVKGVAAETVVLKSVHEMPVSDVTRRAYELPYGGVLGTFSGGWFEAARRYREWVKREPWYVRAASRDFGKLKDVALWMWNRGPRGVTVPPALAFMADTGLKVALDWYWWHEIPYDTGYPFFWPPRESVESFRAGIDAVHRAGGYVQPYTNGMLWDMDDARWRQGGEAGVVIDRSGKPVFETYNPYTNHRQAFMCGEAPAFQATMRSLARTLREAGMDGLYLDMIATAAHGGCYNPHHRHPRGGGRHMTDAFRRYLDCLRADNPGLLLSSEEQGEAYLEKFDSFISVYPSHERFGVGVLPQAEMVPVFEAIYHGAAVLFGSYATIGNVPPWDPKWGTSPAAANMRDPYAGEDLADEKVHPDQFALEFARGVVWGLQPTVHKFLLSHARESRFASDYSFVKATARFYHDNRAFLFDGEMCAPGVMGCEAVSVEFLQRGSYTRPDRSKTLVERGVHAVLHSIWRTKDGTRMAAVLVNWTRQPRTYALRAEGVSATGELPPRSWKIWRVK